MAGINIFAAAALCVTAFLNAGAQTPADIALPEDPAAVIASLDSHSFWSDLSRTNPNPLMTIRADGTITTTQSEQKLTKPELQTLLRFLIEDQEFFSLEAATIKQAINTIERKSGIQANISDAAEVTVRIRTAAKDHEVRFYASSFYAMRYPPGLYPELKSLGQLRAVESKLSQIMETINVGGEQVVLDALAEGNAYLVREYPQIVGFAASDFQRASGAGPYRTLSFFRSMEPGKSATLEVRHQQGEQTSFRYSDQVMSPGWVFAPVLPPK